LEYHGYVKCYNVRRKQNIQNMATTIETSTSSLRVESLDSAVELLKISLNMP